MKRIILMMVTALMAGSMVMAQQNRRGDKMPDAKTRAERMTERMVKEYALNDTQKQQLLEVNLAWAQKMDERAGQEKRHGNARRDDKGQKGEKPQLTEEQRAQMKAEREKRRTEMENDRKAYDEQVQKIMTKEQYALYVQKANERKEQKGLNGQKAQKKRIDSEKKKDASKK